MKTSLGRFRSFKSLLRRAGLTPYWARLVMLDPRARVVDIGGTLGAFETEFDAATEAILGERPQRFPIGIVESGKKRIVGSHQRKMPQTGVAPGVRRDPLLELTGSKDE